MKRHAATPGALCNGAGRPRSPRHRALSMAVTALVVCAIVASGLAAAPVYTDWSAPVSLGPVVNSSVNDLAPALSWDGLSLYIHSNRPGGFGGNDICVSQRATVDSPWGTPVNLGPTINTAAVEFVPSLSPDGHWMFFSSNRAGGFGLYDLYQSYRADIHDDFGWEAPTNLGAGVNTAADENGNGYFAGGGGSPQVFFGSTRPGAPMLSDLYRSSLQPDGTWGPAAAVPELNSAATENRPYVRVDGLEILFYSDRPGGQGGNDLWAATRATVDAPWSTPVNLGPTVNSSASEIHPGLSVDGRTLFFGSSRATSVTNFDLYVTTREQILPATKDECKNGGWERFGVFVNQGDCVSWVATGGKNPPG